MQDDINGNRVSIIRGLLYNMQDDINGQYTQVIYSTEMMHKL